MNDELIVVPVIVLLLYQRNKNNNNNNNNNNDHIGNYEYTMTNLDNTTMGLLVMMEWFMVFKMQDRSYITKQHHTKNIIKPFSTTPTLTK